MNLRLVFVLVVFFCVADAVSRKTFFKKKRLSTHIYNGGKGWPTAGGYTDATDYIKQGHSWSELVDYSLQAEIYTNAGLGLTADDPLQEKPANKFNPRVKKLPVLVGGYSIGFSTDVGPWPKGTIGGYVKASNKFFMLTNGHNCVHNYADPFANTNDVGGVRTHTSPKKICQPARNDAGVLGDTFVDIGTVFKFSFGGTPNLDACLVELDTSTVSTAGYAPVIDKEQAYSTAVRPVKAPTAGMRLEMPCRTSGYLLADVELKNGGDQFTHKPSTGADVVITDIFYLKPILDGGADEASNYGDSGGIWYDPTDGAAVGLNFATSGGRSVAIPMESVMAWVKTVTGDNAATLIRPLHDL